MTINSKNRIDIRKITAASYAAVLQTLKKPDQIQGKPEKIAISADKARQMQFKLIKWTFHKDKNITSC